VYDWRVSLRSKGQMAHTTVDVLHYFCTVSLHHFLLQCHFNDNIITCVLTFVFIPLAFYAIGHFKNIYKNNNNNTNNLAHTLHVVQLTDSHAIFTVLYYDHAKTKSDDKLQSQKIPTNERNCTDIEDRFGHRIIRSFSCSLQCRGLVVR